MISWLQKLEFWPRLIVWFGAFLFEISAVREIISRDTTSFIFTVSLWIFVSLTALTGFPDLKKVLERSK